MSHLQPAGQRLQLGLLLMQKSLPKFKSVYSRFPNKRVGPNKCVGTKYGFLPTHFFIYCYLLPNKPCWKVKFQKINKCAACLL